MRRPVLALLLALLLAGPAARAADVRRMEATGVVGLDPDASWSTPPRDAALRRALSDAVRRIALEELPDLDPAEAEERLAPVLGDDPFVYATRFRIVEDRGERPALLVEDPDVKTEYVVVVEAYVDADRVRERLAAAGLLDAPSGESGSTRVRVVVDDVYSYPAYAAIRAALVDGAGARSATPVEISSGRAVFDVVAEKGAPELLDALLDRAGPGLRIVPLETDQNELVLRVELLVPPAEPAAGEPEAFDTPDRNRY